MEELFSVVLINDGRRKADETYVDFDEESFEAIPVPRVVDDFESAAAPGKHDGDKVIATILSLYERAPARP